MDAQIATRFAQQHVRFFHAENLVAFRAYLNAGAVESRSRLRERLGHRLPTFYSDTSDVQRGADVRVFGNIYDFGSVFGRGWPAVPNIYGPITICFRPSVFAVMRDIAITPKSIVSTPGDWRRFAVTTTDRLDDLLSGGANGPISPRWQFAELSCANDALSLRHAERIIVEPIRIGEDDLAEIVVADVRGAGLALPVVVRRYGRPENHQLLSEMVEMCSGIDLPEDQGSFELPAERLPQRIREVVVIRPDAARQYKLWCRYFSYGTLVPHREQVEQERLDELLERLDELDDRTLCNVCGPGEDRGPALVSYDPGHESGRIDLGYCDSCNALQIRCHDCGAVTPAICVGDERTFDCEGGCGLKFVVTSSRDPDEPPSLSVDVLEQGDNMDSTEEINEKLNQYVNDELLANASSYDDLWNHVDSTSMHSSVDDVWASVSLDDEPKDVSDVVTFSGTAHISIECNHDSGEDRFSVSEGVDVAIEGTYGPDGQVSITNVTVVMADDDDPET